VVFDFGPGGASSPVGPSSQPGGELTLLSVNPPGAVFLVQSQAPGAFFFDFSKPQWAGPVRTPHKTGWGNQKNQPQAPVLRQDMGLHRLAPHPGGCLQTNLRIPNRFSDWAGDSQIGPSNSQIAFPWVPFGISMGFYGVPHALHRFPMGFLWYAWVSYAFQGFPRGFHRFSMVFLGFSMVFIGFSMDFYRFSYDFYGFL